MYKRNFALDNLRIMGMLGVLAIHVGSSTVNTPDFSSILFFCFEIFSRYSIPVFFFISGFGLFSKINLQEPFNYPIFLKKRLKNLLIPYCLWSLFYYLFFFDTNTRKLYILFGYLHSLAFGYACYHLYFMLLLIIFYLTMPVWVKLLRKINSRPYFFMICLFIFQIIFNMSANSFIQPVSNDFLNVLINFRLNFLIPHYLFIFMLGAYWGNNYHLMRSKLHAHLKLFGSVFLVSLLYLIYKFSLLLATPLNFEVAANTLHQLSIAGFLFTSSFIIFAFVCLDNTIILNKTLQNWLNFLAKSSNIVYFIHPLFLYLVTTSLAKYNILVTEPVALALYISVLACCLLSAQLYHKLTNLVTLK